MALPKFVLGASELQFSRGIQYPTSRPHEKIQVADRTASGELQIEDLGIDIRTRPLVFKNLPQADYDNITTWYDTVSDGIMNTFTFYDETGSSMTVRITNTTLDFKQDSYQRYSGQLDLEVVLS